MEISFTKRNSYLASILIHLIVLILVALINLNREIIEDDYITIGFGNNSGGSSTGRTIQNQSESKDKSETLNKVEEKIDLSKTVNVDDNEVANVTKEEKKEDKKKAQDEVVNNDNQNNEYGLGDEGDALGQYGIDLDFGGKGYRRILSHHIPPYPEGVAKDIDIRLRFKILPDGTVGEIVPLRKADTRLEAAAISSLRRWRFEAIPSSKKQIVQDVVITFPFRIR